MEGLQDLYLGGKEEKSVLMDYKHRQMTNLWQIMALKKRRDILDDKLIAKAYVAYSARLISKGPWDVKYNVVEDFSNTEDKFKTWFVCINAISYLSWDRKQLS